MAKLTRGSLAEIDPRTPRSRWRWSYRLDGVRGSRTFAGPKGKKAAWRYVDEVLRPAVLANLPPEPDQWTLAHYLREWWTVKRPTLATEGSRLLYARTVRTHLEQDAIGVVLVRELASRHVEDWLNRQTDRYAVNTVRLPLTLLRMALQWGVDADPPLLARNVARGVKLVADDAPPRVDAYTLEEMQALIAALEPPYGAGIGLGLVGLRIGEVLGLRRREDLDFEHRTIHVRQAVKDRGAQRPIETPKRGKTRTVPMPEWLVPLLRTQIEWSVSWRNQTGLLFAARHAVGSRFEDVPMRGDVLRYALTGLCAKLGLRRLTFHSLRHTFATVMRNAGMTDKDIADALGHASTREVVLRYGVHPDHEARRNARLATALDGLLTAGADAAESS